MYPDPSEIEGRRLRRKLERSPAHPPLVEITVEDEAVHGWPNWQQFSPQLRLPDFTPPLSFTGSNGAWCASLSAAGETLLPAGDGSGSGASLREDLWHLQKRQGLQVSTVTLLVLVLCFGVCLVGLFGFLPMFLIGSRDITVAVQLAQAQAVASIVASTSMTMSRLPNIIHFVVAAYMSTLEGAAPHTAERDEEVVFFLANVMRQVRYRDFLTFMTGVHATPGRERLVGVSALHSNTTLASAVATANETAVLYAVDDETHLTKVPYTVVMDTGISIKDYISTRWCSAQDPYVETNPGGMSASAATTEVWKPWNYTRRFTYFSLMVPLPPSSKAGIRGTFVEGGLRSSYIANMVRDHFRYAVREHGCYMLVDLSRDLVVANSWNQSFRGVEGLDDAHDPFSVANIDHPLMKAAVNALEKRKNHQGVAERITKMQDEQLVFRYNGKMAVLRVSPIRASPGLDLMFLSVIIQRDFFTNINQTLSSLTYTMFAAVIATAVVSYVVAVYLRDAVQHLTVALRASSKLQFTTEFGSCCSPHSRIVEVEDVEETYAHVQQQLMTLKTILPGSLLITENNIAGISDGEVAIARKRRKSAHTGDSVSTAHDENGESSGSDSLCDSNVYLSSGNFAGGEKIDLLSVRFSRSWQQNVVLNTKVFNEKVNVFRKQYCTLVWICRYYTVGVDEATLDRFFDVVYDAAIECKGCIQSLRPDYVVAVFNAHTSLPMHAKLGCEFALAIRKRLPRSATEKHNTLIDTNNYYVGTCGMKNGFKSRVVFDVMPVRCIDRLMREKHYHPIVVTQNTAKHLEYHETVPFDVITVPFHAAPYTLYELRDASTGNIAEMQRTAGLFRSGFQQMRLGDYANALKSFARVDASDVTAQRLRLLCMQNIREGNKEPYMYYSHFLKFRILSRLVHLRKGANLQLFAERMWMQTQVGGFFALGPVTQAVHSEVKGSAHDYREIWTGLRSDRRGASSVNVAANSNNDTVSSTSLTLASSLTVQSLDRLGRPLGYEAAAESSQSNAPSADERESALIEWVDFQSASDTDDAEVVATRGTASAAAAADSILLCLLDSNGEKWNRALKADHTGPASTVYHAIADDGVQAAIKFLPKKNRRIPEARLYNEIMVMAKLKHLNIVKYISYVWTAAHIGIVMEYAPGGSLRDTIDNFGALPESLVRRYMVDILHGLAYLHRGGITHGDVKPHNILLGADGVCKLSDFGSTVSEATDLARSNGMLEFRGTAVYTSPEVASGWQPTAASDIYSLGICFLEMLMGRLPWRWTDPQSHARSGEWVKMREVAFVQAVGRGEIKPFISRQLSKAAQEFAQACCCTSPAERATVTELLSFRFVL
ncbi:putative protein kinase [Leptomonas pyrrhocoris]|uniref:Protein kinase domain-containing protein n=1 Tax=Leptomonas pyrrhocoris TaxID=157538 RepID=A0A0M9G858_LEPPY|nr:putative protein kinase [Leptomonas pyrrhocoris]KPA84587.1 putative protein kinase [Leptomonas pyrrhocoris]|eukprot:XP_015663026.1 putative protein kinase [Leptomonas pyrrhocoris]